MHAIVRQGGGKYYVSAVFGYYHDVKAEEEYERYLEQIYSPYYIVWNEEKTALCIVHAMMPDTKSLIPQILIVDTDKQGWVWDESAKMGGVEFLPRKTADHLAETGELPPDLLEKCRALEGNDVFHPFGEIRTEQDIENLLTVSGGFHDGKISICTMQEDGVLYVLMEDLWGCSLELWFWGDVSYSIESRNPEYWDPYWLEAGLLMENGLIYLVDEIVKSAEEIDENHCWFRAQHMKYHIIPD